MNMTKEREDLVKLIDARIEWVQAGIRIQKKVVEAEMENLSARKEMVKALMKQRDIVKESALFDVKPIEEARRHLRVKDGMVPLDCREWIRRPGGCP